MRVIVASLDREAREWLEGLLLHAGLSVSVLSDPEAGAPELAGAELLIADRPSADAVGEAGPDRRILLVPRGQVVDISSALSGGFMDLLVVPSPEDEVLTRVARALDHFLRPVTRHKDDDAQVQELADIVRRVTVALESSEPPMQDAMHELAEGMLSVFLLLIDSHETNERGTPGHSRKVGAVARAIGTQLKLSEAETGWLDLAGRLHDIGFLPLGLSLGVASELSLELRRSVERHVEVSAQILAPLEGWGFPLEAVRGHHERVDGSGYPKGIRGEQVSLEAQILGAADVFTALTSSRPWRAAESQGDAISAMRRSKGFPRRVLDALERAVGQGIEPSARGVRPPTIPPDPRKRR